MSNVKVDKLPAKLAANTVYIVKDTGVTATDASGKVVINLQGTYYAHNYAGANTIEELQKLWNADLSSLRGKHGATSTPVVTPSPSVTGLKDLYKEFQEGYYEFNKEETKEANNKWIFVKFPKPFSKKPDVFSATVEIHDVNTRINYHGKVTNEGFEVGINYAASFKGVYYYAAVTK